MEVEDSTAFGKGLEEDEVFLVVDMVLEEREKLAGGRKDCRTGKGKSLKEER